MPDHQALPCGHYDVCREDFGVVKGHDAFDLGTEALD